tara:strand:+ start:6424 stop:7395 length:972 start_codon:yes stop_codon:yes gene_type:complete
MENNMDTQNANPGPVNTAFESPVSQGQVEQPQQEAPSLSPADAFGQPEQPAIQGGQPVQPVEPQQNQEVAPPVDNDKVRYEYWQSQASKAQNQLKEFEQIAPLVEYIKQNPYVIQNVQQAQQQATEAPKEDSLPEAPVRPEKPRNFSREEAMSDSSSESAKYMDDMDDWRDKTNEYNRLFTEHQTKKIQDNFEAIQQKEMQAEQVRIQQAAQAEQSAEIQKYAIANFGADEQTAAEFVKEMSSPESVSMNNLWQLFMMKKGMNQPVGQTPAAEPSPQFQQTQAAQQIPSPMGVMPAATTANQSSDADSIMDNLIDGWKAKNPF